MHVFRVKPVARLFSVSGSSHVSYLVFTYPVEFPFALPCPGIDANDICHAKAIAACANGKRVDLAINLFNGLEKHRPSRGVVSTGGRRLNCHGSLRFNHGKTFEAVMTLCACAFCAI